MVLSNRQKQSLHGAMIQYLLEEGYNEAADALSRASGVDIAESKKEVGVLEKKWTSVIRLQKKIMELEETVKGLKEELETAQAGGRKKMGDSSLALPRAPPKHTLKGHRSTVTAVAVHPVYTQLVSCSEDATLKVWDYESGEFERTLKGHTDVVQCVAFSANGNLIASCSADLTIKLWETESYNCVKTLKGHEHNVSHVEFLPPASGKDQIVSSSRDKTIKLWDTNTGYCVKTLSGHSEWVRKVVVDEDGVTAASCSNDHSVRVWRLDTGAQVSTLLGHGHVVEDVAFNRKPAPGKDGKAKPHQMLLVSASRDKSIKVWDVAKETILFNFTGHDNWVRGVVFHPNGKYVISVSDDKSLIIWDMEQNRQHKKYPAHDHFVTGVVMNPRDLVTITCSVDNSIRVWSPL